MRVVVVARALGEGAGPTLVTQRARAAGRVQPLLGLVQPPLRTVPPRAGLVPAVAIVAVEGQRGDPQRAGDADPVVVLVGREQALVVAQVAGQVAQPPLGAVQVGAHGGGQRRQHVERQRMVHQRVGGHDPAVDHAEPAPAGPVVVHPVDHGPGLLGLLAQPAGRGRLPGEARQRSPGGVQAQLPQPGHGGLGRRDRAVATLLAVEHRPLVGLALPPARAVRDHRAALSQVPQRGVARRPRLLLAVDPTDHALDLRRIPAVEGQPGTVSQVPLDVGVGRRSGDTEQDQAEAERSHARRSATAGPLAIALTPFGMATGGEILTDIARTGSSHAVTRVPQASRVLAIGTRLHTLPCDVSVCEAAPRLRRARTLEET